MVINALIFKMESSSRVKNLLKAKLLLVLLCFAAISLAYGCNIFKPRPKPRQQQFIQLFMNNKPASYNYHIKGKYNKQKQRLNIQANDTASFEANTLIINVELGKDTTLAMLKFPRVYSAQTDTLPRRQISYASMHWENYSENTLYENYTYRSYSDLKITLLSFSKDSFLQGTFSGTLWQNKKRMRIRDGKFAVYVKGY